MSALPYDISRCSNEKCPLREDCLRWTDWPDDAYRIPVTRFIPNDDGTCDNQIKPDQQ